jgi:hypothetical protein
VKLDSMVDTAPAKEPVMKHISATAALLMLATPLSAKADPVKVSPLLTAVATVSGQPIVLPQGSVQVVVSNYEIPPGAKLPELKHIYERYGYVLSGQLRITIPRPAPARIISRATSSLNRAGNGTRPRISAPSR